MKLFLDDFTVYNNMNIHLGKLDLCFNKCHEYGISFNLEKCMFMVFFGVILGYVYCIQGKKIAKSQKNIGHYQHGRTKNLIYECEE